MSRDLIKKLPKYYRNSKVMLLLLGTDEAALDEIEQKIKSVDAQCLITTADTSLSRWEQIFGLPNSQDGVERRRERLLARKRGSGGGTIEHLKSVISSFSNGEVDIVEHYDQYMITITFVGEIGVPPYIDDVMAAISDVIPAHIGFTIAIIYRLWSDYADRIWSEVADKTWEELSEGEI